VWGNRLYLNLGMVNGDFITVIYNHLSGYNVEVGATVGRGDVVGYVGTTGWSTGCHLHFTVMENGKPVDPNSSTITGPVSVEPGGRSDRGTTGVSTYPVSASKHTGLPLVEEGALAPVTRPGETAAIPSRGLVTVASATSSTSGFRP
jgi:murein DD-endopeptidase MepM/ murein hydrolase activator NlpD